MIYRISAVNENRITHHTLLAIGIIAPWMAYMGFVSVGLFVAILVLAVTIFASVLLGRVCTGIAIAMNGSTTCSRQGRAGPA